MVRSGLLVLGGLGTVVACAALGPSLQRGPARLTKTEISAAHAAAPAIAASTARTAPCPNEMTFVERACIDRYEAHLLLPMESGAPETYPPYKRPIGDRFIAAAEVGMKPQAYISQLEAANACKNAGKRLCSASEWYGACTSNAARTYPYGTTYVAGRCNVGKAHLLSMLHGADSRRWQYADFNDPKLSEQPGFLALTGEFAGCTTPSGVYDLVGNLHEWVADRVDATLASKLPLPAIVGRHIGTIPGKGIFMGGFYSTTNEHGAGCNFVTAAHDPGYHDYSTGFRCCRDL